MVVGGATVQVGGGADLIAYVGHDGLMDFAAPTVKAPANKEVRRTIILACISQHYFREPLRTTGASPLVWTTGLMAPEAYTLEAAISAWVGGADDLLPYAKRRQRLTMPTRSAGSTRPASCW